MGNSPVRVSCTFFMVSTEVFLANAFWSHLKLWGKLSTYDYQRHCFGLNQLWKQTFWLSIRNKWKLKDYRSLTLYKCLHDTETPLPKEDRRWTPLVGACKIREKAAFCQKLCKGRLPPSSHSSHGFHQAMSAVLLQLLTQEHPEQGLVLMDVSLPICSWGGNSGVKQQSGEKGSSLQQPWEQ